MGPGELCAKLGGPACRQEDTAEDRAEETCGNTVAPCKSMGSASLEDNRLASPNWTDLLLCVGQE